MYVKTFMPLKIMFILFFAVKTMSFNSNKKKKYITLSADLYRWKKTF